MLSRTNFPYRCVVYVFRKLLSFNENRGSDSMIKRAETGYTCKQLTAQRSRDTLQRDGVNDRRNRFTASYYNQPTHASNSTHASDSRRDAVQLRCTAWGFITDSFKRDEGTLFDGVPPILNKEKIVYRREKDYLQVIVQRSTSIVQYDASELCFVPLSCIRGEAGGATNRGAV